MIIVDEKRFCFCVFAASNNRNRSAYLEQIQGIFEKNLLEEKVQTDGNYVQVYMREVRLNVKDPFTYKCNICETNAIEGQQALFDHNKSANHIEKVTELSVTHMNARKM